MKIFEEKEKKDYTVIIGCGRLGANLANALSEEGENVVIIDESKDSFRRLSPAFGGLSLVGSGTDPDMLSRAQVEKATAVIAVTNDDNTNIMVTQLARDLFRAERVIARLYDPEREMVYRQLGIDTICPAALSAREIDRLLEAGKEKEVLS